MTSPVCFPSMATVRRLGAIAAIAFGCASEAPAAPLAEGWTSVRALGMGNAFTAVADDNDAIFYNPAGLSAVQGFRWTIADPRAGANGVSAYNLYQQYQSNSSPAGLFQSLYGAPIWVGGGAKSALALPGIGIAAFANSDAHFVLSNPAFPTAEARYFFDYGVATAFALPIVPSVLSLGVGVKRINRTGAALDAGPSTLAQLNTTLLQNQLKNRGTGYGLDVGLRMTLPTPIKPMFGIAWKDVGYTAFTFEEGVAAPNPTEPNLTVGAAVEVGLPGLSIMPSVDFRYADRPDIQIGKKIGMGVEFHLLLLNLRAGLNQGYWTAGVGLDFGLLKFDAATWGVELGEYAGQRQERRYMGQMTIEIDFDPGKFFGSITGSGSSRGPGGSGGSGRPRLKQRR